jgi:hypothetical protein
MSEDNAFKSGAVRSADANHLDFGSLPLVGLIGVARTAAEGASKYGAHNYMLGMPAHDMLNHAMRHIVMFRLGDRSEPHLEHAAWNVMAAIQSLALDPALNAPHLLGPGATIGPEMRAALAEDAPILAAKRKAGEADPGNWKLTEIPEIKRILDQRTVIRVGKQLNISDRVRASESGKLENPFSKDDRQAQSNSIDPKIHNETIHVDDEAFTGKCQHRLNHYSGHCWKCDKNLKIVCQ